MTDRKLMEKNAFFTQALSAPAEAGFSCICVAQDLQDLPRECSRVVEVEGETACVYAKGEPSGQRLALPPRNGGGHRRNHRGKEPFQSGAGRRQ